MYSWAWEANYKIIDQPVRERVTDSTILICDICTMKFLPENRIQTGSKAQGSRKFQEILDLAMVACLSEAPFVKNISKTLRFRGLHCVKELCDSSHDRSLTTTAN